jgi:hypothetical protein
MGIKREKGQSTTRGKALAAILCTIAAILLFVLTARAEEPDRFRKVKEAVKKSGKPHYFTDGWLQLSDTSKQRILIVFVEAPVPDWLISYHPVDGASRVLFIFKPSLSRSIAFERWATNANSK